MRAFIAKLLKWRPKRREPPNPIELAIESLLKIQPSSMIRVFSPDMYSYKVPVLGSNIDEHTRFLEKYRGYIVNVVEFDPAILPDVNSLPIQQWFIDRRHRYLDPAENFESFRNAAIEFLRAFMALEAVEKKSYEQGRFVFLLGYFKGNLLDIEKLLSHEFSPQPRHRVSLSLWRKDQVG